MIESVEINPVDPTAADGLTVAVQVQDPDLDAIDVELEWFVNGSSAGLTEPNLDPYQFHKGDRVHVVVWASDGSHEVTHASDPIEIVNSPPRITSLELTPKAPLSTDMIEVNVTASDNDEDTVSYEYRWLMGDTPIPGETGPRLVSSKLKRSVRIAAQVRALDETGKSEWITSNPVKVSNAPPTILSQPNYSLSGPTRYTYQMRADDPDGDTPLKYELIAGPPGMQVSATTGLVDWTIQPGTSGRFPVELAVSDPYGGQVAQKYQLEVDWRNSDDDSNDGSARADDDEADSDDDVEPANAAPDADITRPTTDYEVDVEEDDDSDSESADDEGEDEDEF